MTNTPNYNMTIAEGTDTVNLLTQCYPNFTIIDTAMKANKDAGISAASEVKTGTNHAITRTNTGCAVFRFVATSNYVSGDTFTVDAEAVTANTPDGKALVSGAFVINQNVLCILNGTQLTVLVPAGATTAEDSEKLGGELPAYYAKQSDMETAESDIDNLENNLSNNYYNKASVDSKVKHSEAVLIGEYAATTTVSVSDIDDYAFLYCELFSISYGNYYNPILIPVSAFKMITTPTLLYLAAGTPSSASVEYVSDTQFTVTITANAKVRIHGIK